MERAARETLEEARSLSEQAQAQEDLSAFRDEYDDANQTLQQAREQYTRDEFESALENGERSVAILSSILNALSDQGSGGEAHIISVAGRVEFRRGEVGEWEDARIRVSLRDGYYLRTSSNGSAEIMFIDGTLYTVRPDTLFYVSSNREGGSPGQTIRMEYGWVDLSTARQASRVATPGAQAEVQEESSATVAYDQTSRSGRFAAYRGGLKVDTDDGGSQQVAALQEVVQQRGRLSEPRAIPQAPIPQAPRDSYEQSLSDDEPLVLTWRTVYGADRYALQISRSPLFVDNIIDTADRRNERATLGVRGAGSFVWRVAAIDGEGRRGPWSQLRKFRISSAATGEGLEQDTEPPPLALNDVQAYGSIFIVSGATEPGASVSVRGEPVKVAANGTFTKTVQVHENGWSFVEVRSKDAYGNETVRPIRLYVDNF
ncbi:MAG: hypothetical protein SX243_02900 [Acidobacteriota bacterium]|nr:hypothetical protein [Acidobacteriota bacterium]